MNIIEFLAKGGKAGEQEVADVLNFLSSFLNISKENVVKKLESLDDETVSEVSSAIKTIMNTRNNGGSAAEVEKQLAIIQKVFTPSEKQGGKLEQLVDRFAKGGTMNCGCGKKLKCGGKPKKKENGGIAKAQEGTLLWAPNSKAKYEEFMRLYGNKSIDTAEPIKNSQSFSQDYEKNFGDKIRNMTAATIAGYGTTPVKQTTVVEQTTVPYLTRRQARELSKENRGYNNSMFRTAYANMKAGLREQNPGVQGKVLRQQARYNVAGVRNPIEVIPIATDNITASPIVMENPKNAPQNMGVLDLRGHNIGVVDENAINNALAKAVIAGRAGSGRQRRQVLGDRYAPVQAIVDRISRPRILTANEKAAIEEAKQRQIDEANAKRAIVDIVNSSAINLRPGVDSVYRDPTASSYRPNLSGYNEDLTTKYGASTIPAAIFNAHYAPLNWGHPYSESYSARELLNGRASRNLQYGGELENPNWQQIWKNQKALPVENDSETATLKPIQQPTFTPINDITDIQYWVERPTGYDGYYVDRNGKKWIVRNNQAEEYKCGGKVEKAQGGTRVGNEKPSVWKRLYNGVETALKGTDYDLSEEEYLQKHGYIRPKATVAPLPTFRTPTQNPEDLIRLKKVMASGKFNSKPSLDFDLDKFTKPISWWDRNGEALLWALPAVGIPSAIGGAMYKDYKNKKKEKPKEKSEKE